jgi:hypothetical protein
MKRYESARKQRLLIYPRSMRFYRPMGPTWMERVRGEKSVHSKNTRIRNKIMGLFISSKLRA